MYMCMYVYKGVDERLTYLCWPCSAKKMLEDEEAYSSIRLPHTLSTSQPHASRLISKVEDVQLVSYEVST